MQIKNRRIIGGFMANNPYFDTMHPPFGFRGCIALWGCALGYREIIYHISFFDRKP